MTKQFSTTKEELQKLSKEFNSQAFTLIDDFLNLAFWLLLKKRAAKNIVWITYKKAIYYCDKTKAGTDWNTWMHRIFFNRIFEYYNDLPKTKEFDFELIDNWKFDLNPALTFEDKFPGGIDEKGLIVLLRGIPQILLIPLILKDVCDFSYEKIAEFVDVPDGVISTRVYRARKLISIRLLSQNSGELKSEKGKSDLILSLRAAAELVDNELSDPEKKSFEEKIITNIQLKTEFELQELVKNLLRDSITKIPANSRLRIMIKKRAEKRFFIDI
jgi:DNA-directed RNA polymerase specialized sigma24 family protein